MRPEATLFVDDSPTNVAGAKAARLQGHCYTTTDALAREFEGYGLL